MTDGPGNPPQISPDGHWLWNGTAWVPNDAAPASAGQPPAPASSLQAPATASPAKKPWFRQWWGIGIIAVGGFILLAAIFGSGSDSETGDGGSAASSSAESTDEPTNETTDEPQEGTESSEEPVEEPEPVSVYDNFGTFTPIKDSGSGDSVVKLGDAADATAVAVTAKHSGDSNFVIEALNSDNDSTELLVNTIGGYSGTTYLPIEDVTRLKISADGSWSIKISPIADMKEVTTPLKTKGDKVLLYSADATDWAIKHNGESNFAMYQVSDDGQDLLINEIGNYSGTIPMAAGPSIIIVTADGTWTIKNG
jgi:hypothetical protein